MHRRQRKGREWVRLDAGPQPFERAPAEHVDLQIGLFEPRVALDERAGIDPAFDRWPERVSTYCAPASSFFAAADRQVVDGDRLGAAPDEIGVEVIVQVAADAWHVAHHRDAVLLQLVGRAESRQLQQLRRAVDAARNDRPRRAPAP